MIAYCLLVYILLSVSRLEQVWATDKNVTDILKEHNENELQQAPATHFENIIGLKNESNYELECDCGFGSKGCKFGMYFQKNCECIADYAQYMDKCIECNCGLKSDGCIYNDKSGKKTCYCLTGYSQHDGKCKKCDCGDKSIGCLFNREGEKLCDCIPDYAQNNDKCERCYCGLNSIWCKFENNKKVCTCSKNYLQDDYGQCVECDCGLNSINCYTNGFNKDCVCREGYAAVDGGCERCDCGSNSIACEFTFDRLTRCTREAGYIAQRTTWKEDEYCTFVPEGSSGWRIATYIESLLFAMIIVVCTGIICCKRLDNKFASRITYHGSICFNS